MASVNILENFRLRDLPPMKRAMQAMAEHGVAVMPGHICAPTGGQHCTAWGSAPTRRRPGRRAPHVSVLPLVVADPPLRARNHSPLLRAHLELCVPKRG